jgi:hypothetical protein
MSTSLLTFLRGLQDSGFYGSVELKFENGRLTIARKTESLKFEDTQNQHRNNRGSNAETRN